MRACLAVFVVLAGGSVASAHGLLIPTDKNVPPLAMARHEVTIAIEDQTAVTRVEQTFHNHTDRDLEAIYVFPVPKGGAVTKFTMQKEGKQAEGTLVDAQHARAIYSEAVRRSRDPGLLEYLGNHVFQLKVFPVPAHKTIQVSLSYTSELERDAGVIQYVYPLKTDGKSTATLEKFGITATLKSQHGLQTIYSPTHAVGIERPGNREAKVLFRQDQALLDRDFQLLFTLGEKDVGLTALMHRPEGAAKGHFLMLLSPRPEAPKEQVQPRDFVLVLDVSGSMEGTSIKQAKAALRYVLNRLGANDRFGLISFSDRVNPFGPGLWSRTAANVKLAKEWVDALQAVGGTNINDALLAALAMRSQDPGRTFTVIFFTDGQPTVGETKPEKIVANVTARNTANTRLFTFGVGHDVNATLLDQLALGTRAASVYVQPSEDIEAKVSSLYQKISQPVLVDLRIAAGPGVILDEMYPASLPDLFHGGQVMVLGRYLGQGKTKITLHGKLGKEDRSYSFDVDFPQTTGADRAVVETIWARRKIGYLLDQIRGNGEQKELVESVVSLAKAHGIATPYTSYFIVPETPLPVVGFGQSTASAAPSTASPRPVSQGGAGAKGSAPKNYRGFLPPSTTPLDNTNGGFSGGKSALGGGAGFSGGSVSQGGFQGNQGNQGGFGGIGFQGSGFGNNQGNNNGGSAGRSFGAGGGQGGFGAQGGYGAQGGQAGNVRDWARAVQAQPGALAGNRGQVADNQFSVRTGSVSADGALAAARQTKVAFDQAQAAFQKKQHALTQGGQLGVDLSVQSAALRTQSRAAFSALRKVAGRSLLEVGGVWIDEGFTAQSPTFTIQALSPAYFRLLDRQPPLRELFQLGNNLVWVSPSGIALIIDSEEGHEQVGDVMLDYLFDKRKQR